MRPLHTVAALVFSSLALPLPLCCRAQAPAPTTPDPGKTVLHLTTNLTVVDVVVTNQGKAVHGLERQRFHIFEDGQEQRITSFDEHLLTPTPAQLATPSPLPPHTYSNLPSYPEASALNVILLDELNTPFESRDYLHRQLLDYLHHASPGTSLAIFSLTSRLRLLQGFTTDLAQLAAALQPSPKAGSTLESDHHTVDSMGASKGSVGAGFAAATLGQFSDELTADQTNRRADITLQATLQLAHYLSAIPGRKNLIWFSGAFPLDSDPGAVLSAARVAVYPVDSRGVAVSPGSGAGFNELNSPPNVGALNNGFAQQTGDDHHSMQQLADQTGGHAFVNTNSITEAIASAVENGASYYTIGYAPPTSALNGHFRDIKVRLDNPAGDTLAYRHTFYAAPPADPSTAPSTISDHPSPLTAATVLGAPSSTQILFQARVLPSTDPLLANTKLPEGFGGQMTASLHPPIQHMIVDLMLSAHNLQFDPSTAPDGAHRARLEVTLVAYDANANRINYLDRPLLLNMDGNQYAWSMTHGIPIRLPFDLPSGQSTLRIAVADLSTNRTGSLEAPLTIDPTPPTTLPPSTTPPPAR
jgi:VWFA-related protein